MFIYINVTAHYLSDYTLLAFLGAILVGVTLLAGAYPAFYISRFNAANIFRGSVKFGGSNLFSRLLLGLQVVISFITVIAGMAFSRNTEFQRNYNYGYDKENIIGLNLQNESTFLTVSAELSKSQALIKLQAPKIILVFLTAAFRLKQKGKRKRATTWKLVKIIWM